MAAAPLEDEVLVDERRHGSFATGIINTASGTTQGECSELLDLVGRAAGTSQTPM